MRQLHRSLEFSATFYRVAASRAGLTVTDLEVIGSLASGGPTTAGRLAEITGLTTGAITGMINRLEEAGIVRRERDPADARRVIVQLAPGDAPRELSAILATLDSAREELAAGYDDAQVAQLLEFTRRDNALLAEEIARLRGAPTRPDEVLSVPLGGVERGQLAIAGSLRLTVRASAATDDLYRARFEGHAPDVKVNGGAVTIRYPRRLLLQAKQIAADVQLNPAIPWQISIQGGASMISATLGGLTLTQVDIKGGASVIDVQLPMPSGTVPVRISGGASQISIRRPRESAARMHLKGWAAMFVVDDQKFSDLSNDVRMQSPEYDSAADRYDIEIVTSTGMATITTE